MKVIIEETEFNGQPLDGARTLLRDKAGELMTQALRWHDARRTGMTGMTLGEILTPRNAIRSTTGVGKSEELRQAVPGYVREAKEKSLPHRILIAVSTHKLAEEAQKKMPDGVNTHVWQGRGGKYLATGEPMCNNPQAVEAAIKIGANVEETACKRKQYQCPFFTSCHYQAQKGSAAKDDVVYVAHEALFNMPKALGEEFGLVIIDESFWQAGLATKVRLAISGLALELDAFPVRDVQGWKDQHFTSQLRGMIERLQSALAQMPDGYVTRQQLLDAGLTAEDSAEAVGLEWARKVDHGLRPGASAERQQKAVKHFGFLAQLPAREQMWKALEDLLDGNAAATGRLWIETKTTKEGSQRWLRINQRKEVDDTIDRLPMIITDATLPLRIVRHFLFNVRFALDLDVAAPHMRITQVIGKAVGKSALQALDPDKRSADEERRVAGNRQALVETARHLARNRIGLVITYKSIEDEFKGIPGIRTGHYGAIEGIDVWGNVDVAVIIGRPLPKGDDIQTMAAALTGQPEIAGKMIKQHRIVCGDVIACIVYPGEAAEMIRQAVCDTAVVQAAGRVRGVNRTAANPVELYLFLTDVVPDLPINAVVKFGDICPGVFDEMFARGPVPEWPGDAAKLYPDLFISREAAKKAYRRGGLAAPISVFQYRNGSELGTIPYKNILIRDCPQFAIRFRTKGRGSEVRIAWIDPAKVSEARAVLEAALGPLVLFEVLEPAPEAEPEPTPDTFPGDKPWPKSDPDLEPMSLPEWQATVLRGLRATF